MSTLTSHQQGKGEVFKFCVFWMPLLSFQEMTSEEKSKITDLNKCNFSEMSEYFKAQSEARKQMSKEEKQVGLHRCGLSQP